jgi:23S rRNA (pseudouridine1915-N3)-methyltransferase
MSGLLLLWVGRQAPGAWQELAEEYRVRIARLVACNDTRVRPEAGRAADPKRALRNEAARVREYLREGDTLIVLDERGRQMTSEQLAGWLSPRLPGGRIVLVIGSDLGTDPALRREASDVWALSRLTLPHLLVRVVVLEQLYRALDIIFGGRYHRA